MRLYYSGSDAHDGQRSELVIWRGVGGALERVSAKELVSPSWVVAHPSRPLLYATQETEPGGIVTVGMAEDGSLQEQQRLSSNGSLPCHIALNRGATRLAASNYLDGTVSVWKLTEAGMIADVLGAWQLAGSGPVADRQDRSHAHAAYFRDTRMLAVDLGADSLWELAADGTTRARLRLPAGFGPRHLVSVGRNLLVLVGELSSQLALIEFNGSAARVLDTKPATASSGGQPSGITVWRDNVIVANRGVGSFAQFKVAAGRLVPSGEVELPGSQHRAIMTNG
ncbi:MAG: lactonase family protein, partial [Propionibacteriaceae bacterium]|nr:lactonase family protein [Propionibacteriaceae bacterium]